jgi:hypothetical protein
MLKTDIFDRAVPWARLILSERRMPNDLNLRRGQRLNAVLALVTLLVAPMALVNWNYAVAWLAVLGAYLTRNWRFYSFLVSSQGPVFALRAIPVHWLYFIYGCTGFAIGVVYHLLPQLVNHRDSKAGERRAGG